MFHDFEKLPFWTLKKTKLLNKVPEGVEIQKVCLAKVVRNQILGYIEPRNFMFGLTNDDLVGGVIFTRHTK